MAQHQSPNALPERTPSLCMGKSPDPIHLPDGITHKRARAILAHTKKWANGTALHFFFHEDEQSQWSDAQRDIVRWAFDEWKGIGLGLEFTETDDRSEAEIRIGFDQNDGSWSWVGTDVLANDDNGRNMNFGWDLRTDWGKATALHEIGHMLGLNHGHLNPKAGIEWNENAVYDHYSGAPNNWDQDTIYWNIIRKLDPAEVTGSDWDPYSIMHYPIRAGLIHRPNEWQGGTPENLQLSNQDIAWAREFYPDDNATHAIGLLDFQPLRTLAGEQSDFQFSPDATRNYSVSVIGEADVRLVIFVERDGEFRHFASEDESGTDNNTAITAKFVKGEKYMIRARVLFAGEQSGLGLVIV